MNERSEVFVAYASAIVSVRDPGVQDVQAAWSDPALFCVLRNSPAAVITPWNPGLLELSEPDNRKRSTQLHARLVLEGYECWDSLNSAPDGSHAEPGFLVWGITPQQARAIAQSFDQWAFFWYSEDGERSVINCDHAGE